VSSSILLCSSIEVQAATAEQDTAPWYRQDIPTPGLSTIAVTYPGQFSAHPDLRSSSLTTEDAAQAIRYFNNQRIEPIKTYCYDTLDQLIEASGREAKTGHGGPARPDLQPLPLDPNQVAHYTQTYHYDAGGNLLNLVHVGAQAHGRTLTRAQYSNRCLPERNDRPPTEAELAAGFDANGNLRELQIGQTLEWDLRNQLTVVRPVVRDEAEDDFERYIYDGGGQRVRKVRANQTSARTLISEVRYLPGVEIRSHGGTGEILHVINVSAGSNSVQVLHWVAQKPDDIANDQVRYSLNDHLQSSTVELDQNANLISQEWYYPFGGTACFAARSATEAKYKTVRYSGKERDATGLYYYGFRYYAPWLQRWINPDPAGFVDGTNLYAMVTNSPATYRDKQGNIRENFNPEQYLENFKTIFIIDPNRLKNFNPEKLRYHGGTLLSIDSLRTEAHRANFAHHVTELRRTLHPFESIRNNYPRNLRRQVRQFYLALDSAIEFRPFAQFPEQEPDERPPEYAEVAPPSYEDAVPPAYSAVDPLAPSASPANPYETSAPPEELYEPSAPVENFEPSAPLEVDEPPVLTLEGPLRNPTSSTLGSPTVLPVRRPKTRQRIRVDMFIEPPGL
jgi:RHS repeat-associated protein